MTAEAERAQPPEPHEIFERMREEGRRRLRRPRLELGATALVGGFDVAFGVLALGLTWGAVAPRFGSPAGHLAGALAFGIGFVFVVVGRSELFTENFLVPIAGLERTGRSLRKLGELWAATLVLNLVGGFLLVLLLTSHGVIRAGDDRPLVGVAHDVAAASALAGFLSAVVAGALLTLMTWFVEGAASSTGVRITMAWLTGFLVALGGFNHAIVGSVELMFGMRLGAGVSIAHFFGVLGIAVAGNLAGGIALVTFTRIVQAGGASRS